MIAWAQDGLVVEPVVWPTQADGSNALVRCIAMIQDEAAKANDFLATGLYKRIQGGPKGESLHCVTPYPAEPQAKWIIFFDSASLNANQIIKRYPTNVAYRISIDPVTRHLVDAQPPNQVLACDTNGRPKAFGQQIKDRIWHEVRWDGTNMSENVWDWAKRGKPISK